jgi:phosphatidylglycerol:prolipoprotein diacylglycerol transferase
VLPYFEQPTLSLGPIHLYAFGAIVAVAVVVGVELLGWRGRKSGLEARVVQSFAIWIVGAGFLGAHLLDALWYHPGEVLASPSILLIPGSGFSSFGGFLGAIAGAFAWRARKQQEILPYIDVTLSVFPIAWTIGRLACTVAHDHPGVPTSADNPLAFAFPDGPRWDLGFLEMLFSLVLSGICVFFWRRPRPLGTYVALTALAYAPARFALDFLRLGDEAEGDARYGDLTPAQWCCLVLLFIGIAALWDLRAERARARRDPRVENIARDQVRHGPQRRSPAARATPGP